MERLRSEELVSLVKPSAAGSTFHPVLGECSDIRASLFGSSLVLQQLCDQLRGWPHTDEHHRDPSHRFGYAPRHNGFRQRRSKLESLMKASVITTMCSAPLCLAHPTALLRPGDSTDANGQRELIRGVDGMAAGFATGVVTGFYATALGQDIENEMLENRYSKGFRDGYALGKWEAWESIDEKHQELVECWEEKLEMRRHEIPGEPEDEYEERVWSLCRAEKDVDVFQPAFIMGPRKTGLRYFYQRPSWSSSSTSTQLGGGGMRGRQQKQGHGEGGGMREGQQKQDHGEGRKPPQDDHKKDEKGGGNQKPFSEFSAVKHGLVSKVKQLGRNIDRVVSAAMHAKPQPFAGFLGGSYSRPGVLGGTNVLTP
ncbi:MAG: hypothetical protein M1816_001240 [Peltula sp. TS41687]|nr:MAG: hypothetical protein M1816_001240 [Peltula sp. TS41687]